MKSYVSHSLEETRDIADQWLKDLTDRYGNTDIDEATLVGLSGHLGAGKTAFVKTVGSILGVREEITSPTFVIMKIYPIVHPKWKRLIHIDAYRLEKREELEVLEWEKLVSDLHNLIMIEWPENVSLNEFAKMCKLIFLANEKTHQIEVSG